MNSFQFFFYKDKTASQYTLQDNYNIVLILIQIF